MRNQLKAGAVLSYVSLFLNSVISIIYTPIMLNLLGQSEYGLYSLAASTAGYVGILNFGLGNAVIRYIAKCRALNDEDGCSRLYGMFFIMYGVLGVLALIGGTILTLKSHLFFGNSLSIEELTKIKILMGIMTINLSVGIGLGMFSVVVLAHDRFIVQKLIVIATSIFNPFIMLPLLLMGYGSIAMAVVTTVLNFVSIIVNLYYCFRVLRIKIVFKKFESSLLKEILIFSFYIFINLIIGKLYGTTDQLILGIYSGTVAVSIYTIGNTFTGYFSGFSSAISNVFLGKVSGMVSKEVTEGELSNLFIRIGRVQYIILSFTLSGFIVFGQEFINLWVGKDYRDSFIIALLILIPLIFSLVQEMGGVILQAKNRQKFKTLISFGIAVMNVILSVIFVQWWGAIGCAIATAISMIIGKIIIINIYYWKKIKIDIPRFWKNIILMSFPLALCVVFGTTLNKLIFAESWWFLGFKMVVFSTVFLLLMWFTGMNAYEKDLLIQPFKKMARRLPVKRVMWHKNG
ncbi:polysaccharide biosynthesis protein [Robertmurraya yapensis]|uniref:Polysaccharide biosynthesis protein n=2 Tax=Bacillaceae TaxID=186817 RepID=A0A3S0JVT2_9BACI|nr:oligosaccharide flippase family protein [Bacillus yapensis]RTR30002.1 polysaccharide biosynthesis protein [Bacillus yapensis]TKS95083.1 polysaccharide biosynthesis protein [Bacillus yapensis]